MGNVQAAETNVPAPPIIAPPPPPTTGPGGAPAPEPPQTPVPEAKADTGPGSFEDIHKTCKDVFPMPFEGAKLLINKGLSNHFQISHTMTMSSIQPSGYRFGCTYVGKKQYSPTEAFPILVADIDPSGNLNSNIIHAFTESLRGKFVAQIQNSKWMVSQMTTDYKGSDFTAALTLANIDLVNESGVAVSQYLQKVTSRASLGCELLYQYGPQVPGGQIALYTIAGRYRGDKWTASSSLTPMAGGAHLCYHHKCNDTLQVGVELEGSLRSQECSATVGYQVDIPKANLVFRGQFDTNYTLAAVLEKKLDPLPFTFCISGMANQVKASYRFGIGLIVG